MDAINFYQITWGGDSNLINVPAGITREQLVNGTAFEPFYPITRLGIQAAPGTRFFVNNDVYPIMIGPSGIWEIDASAGALIRLLQFDNSSIDLNVTAQSVPSIIIDMMYAGEGIS